MEGKADWIRDGLLREGRREVEGINEKKHQGTEEGIEKREGNGRGEEDREKIRKRSEERD